MLKSVAEWRPFRLDALGILTLLGAEEVDFAVGRLTKNSIVEYLPMLGAFVICGNRFVQIIPGNVIYNITDGIMATDVSGWLSRWLLKQNPKWSTTTYTWSAVKATSKRQQLWMLQPFAAVLGVVVNFGLLALTVLLRDWFGLANTISMIVSVFVRSRLTQENREYLDLTVAKMTKEELEPVKCFCLLSNGKAATIFAPRHIVLSCFLTTSRPPRPKMYGLVRALGWIGFACHVITIGQATLIIQLLTIVIMLSATTIFVLGGGSNDFEICKKLQVTRSDCTDLEDRRTVTYAKLALTTAEENTMLAWALMPQRSNTRWWDYYFELKEASKVGKLGSMLVEDAIYTPLPSVDLP